MTRTFEDMYPPAADKPDACKEHSLLLPTPTAAARARVSIAHAQLRHLIWCPERRGTVYYISGKSIVEIDLLIPDSSPRYIVELDFPATCFAVALAGSNPTSILFAAGGYSSDLHLSLHSFPPTAQARSASPCPPPSPKLIWRHSSRLRVQSEIVNSILFSPVSLTDDTCRSSTDLRMAICGNDSSVKFYDIRMQPSPRDETRAHECGMVKLNTPINHVSISPDGRTLLCVGDTPEAYLFDISPGPKVTFSPLATYALPAPPPSGLRSLSTHPPPTFRSLACFTTAWSADGLKFAVASQEGQLCVWDVRSARPLFTFWTAWRRNSTGRHRLGEWEWEDLGGPMRTEDATTNGPDSGIRNVKFSAGEGGRELMVFTEHTTNIHVIDARTFDLASHNIIPFPDIAAITPAATHPRSASPPSVIRASSPMQPYPSLTVTDGRRSRSRTRSPSPRRSLLIISRSRSRSRSRSGSPPYSPAVIVNAPTTPPIFMPPPRIQPEERGLHWPPFSGDLDHGHDYEEPESRERERLDPDGDIIEGGEYAVGGDVNGDPILRWPRRGGRPLRLGMTRPPVIAPTTAPLASVAESREPVPPRPTHLAGMCFDPSGGWVYVASESGIVEWRVREREEGKTSWGSGSWA